MRCPPEVALKHAAGRWRPALGTASFCWEPTMTAWSAAQAVGKAQGRSSDTHTRKRPPGTTLPKTGASPRIMHVHLQGTAARTRLACRQT